MPLDKQAAAERALKLGRGTQAVIGASLGEGSSFPKFIVFFRNADSPLEFSEVL